MISRLGIPLLDPSIGLSKPRRSPAKPFTPRSAATRNQAAKQAPPREAPSADSLIERRWEAELGPGGSARPPILPFPISRIRRGSKPTISSSSSSISTGAAGTSGTNAQGGPPDVSLFSIISERWDGLPARYQLLAATSLSFVICNMDKVNISVAIIPMAADFGWSPTTAGLVQSSFFYGYLLSQIPGGYLVSRLGGRRVLPAGVGLWSVATGGVPLLAATIPGLCLSRAAVGLGEGCAPAAATDIVARIVPAGERSRAVSFVFGGLHVGSLIGLTLAPPIIENFGWEAVFYLFGGLGTLWAVWWEKVVAGVGIKEPGTAAALTRPYSTYATQDQAEDAQCMESLSSTSSSGGGHGGAIDLGGEASVPWRGILRNGPLRALAFVHFSNNWFHYTMLAWLPTYFSDTLSLDLSGAARVSILPPLAAIAVSCVAGPLADGLLAKQVAAGTVRKAAQCAAFLGPASCLVGAAVAGDGLWPLALITLALGLGSFSLAGLYCNHADLSPRYAPLLLGLTNTMGAVPGIIGVAFTGSIYDESGSWELALFAPSVLIMTMAAVVYVLWGSADAQDFAGADAPFWWETRLRQALQGGGGGESEKGE